MIVTKKQQAPKTYRTPKDLTLEATGLLAHMREHLDSDGHYSWGVLKTADYFGVDHRKIREAYHELEDTKRISVTQSGKNPRTGKNLLKIVRLTARLTTEAKPVALAPSDSSEKPVALVLLDLPTDNKGSSAPSRSTGKTSGISAPHYINCIAVETPMSVSDSNEYVGERGANATGQPDRDTDRRIAGLRGSLALAKKSRAKWLAQSGNEGAWGDRIAMYEREIAELEASGQREISEKADHGVDRG